MASPASSSSRTTRTSSSTKARRPRRAATPTGRSERPTSPAFRAAPNHVRAVRIWVMAARVRTLPAAVAPVLVGTSLALGASHFHPLAFVAALLGAIFIQVGTNLSNDYSDARRGADTEDRLGPVRGTAGGVRPPPPGARGAVGAVGAPRASRAGPPARARRPAVAGGRGP